jgi:hypothetical protein
LDADFSAGLLWDIRGLFHGALSTFPYLELFDCFSLPHSADGLKMFQINI